MKQIIVVTILLVVIVSATAVTCYSDGGQIYGCYQKNNGQLRVVSNPGECRPSEVSVFWNQTGPQGPIGPPGTAALPICPPGQLLMSVGPAEWECRLLCSGQLINPQSDDTNCGECGHICAVMKHCTGGLCSGCVPSITCASMDATCGRISDGCGGSIDCGTCRIGNCVSNRCYANLIGSMCTNDSDCTGVDSFCLEAGFCTRACGGGTALTNCNNSQIADRFGYFGGFYSCWSLGEGFINICWPNGSGADCSKGQPCPRAGELCISGSCFYPGTALEGARSTTWCNVNADCLTGESCFSFGYNFGNGFAGWCLWHP